MDVSKDVCMWCGHPLSQHTEEELRGTHLNAEDIKCNRIPAHVGLAALSKALDEAINTIQLEADAAKANKAGNYSLGLDRVAESYKFRQIALDQVLVLLREVREKGDEAK